MDPISKHYISRLQHVTIKQKITNGVVSNQVLLTIFINALCALHLLHEQHQTTVEFVPNASQSVFFH
jgi:hypothetical protein